MFEAILIPAIALIGICAIAIYAYERGRLSGEAEILDGLRKVPKTIEPGKVSKGGLNGPPTAPRPSPSKPMPMGKGSRSGGRL